MGDLVGVGGWSLVGGGGVESEDSGIRVYHGVSRGGALAPGSDVCVVCPSV